MQLDNETTLANDAVITAVGGPFGLCANAGGSYTEFELEFQAFSETTEDQRRAAAKALGYDKYDDFAFTYKGRRFVASFERLAELMAPCEVITLS